MLNLAAITAVLYFTDFYFVNAKLYRPSQAGLQLLYYTPGIGSKCALKAREISADKASWRLQRNDNVQHLPTPNISTPIPRLDYRSDRNLCLGLGVA